MRPIRRIAAAALAAAALAVPARAQAPRTMTIVDLIDLPSLSSASLSPDGARIVYARSEPDWKADRRVSHLWIADVATGRSTQITSGEHGESGPAFSPDGRWVAFTTRRGEDEANQVYLLPMAGGEAVRLTRHATGTFDLTWAPDGSAVYFRAADPRSAEEKAAQKAKDDVFAFDENYQQDHLWKVSVPDGKETRITSGDYDVSGYDLSRDGARLVVHRAPNPLYGYADRGELWIMDASGQGALQLTRDTVMEGGGELSPDGSEVLFTCGCNAGLEVYHNTKMFLVPAAGGAPRMLLPDMTAEVERASWSKDGKAIYFTANMGVHSELFRYDLGSGKATRLTDGQHALRWSYEPRSGTHILQIDRPDNAGDIYLLASDDGKPRQVTHVYDHYAADFRLPRQEKITWKGVDGVEVEGLLYYPLDYQQGRRYPLVVQSHGGPQASVKFGFGHWSNFTQVLTAMGYAVLQPNYRGSTGYGDAFQRDMVGHYFNHAHTDVMRGVDRVIAMGIAAPDSLVAMGWSAGGHMTDKLITFTDRFKAASSGAGAANWISMYAQSDVRTYRTPWFLGTPWQKNAPIQAFWDNSPLKDVWKVKTPTIFLVGQQDPRVPMPQSVEMYRALHTNGVPTHLYVAPREPHGWQELRHELFQVNADLSWFEKWVRGRDYTWEKAPGTAHGGAELSDGK